MTRITYFAFLEKKEKNRGFQDIPSYNTLWSEVVTGDLEARKEEIRKEHRKSGFNWPVYFYDNLQVDDYLDFEI